MNSTQILGLSNPVNYFEPKTRWQLLYLFYHPGIEAAGHMEEAMEFAAVAKSDGIDFHVLTYQTLVAAIRKYADASHIEYLEYLEKRYFA
jgi:hypothetical protein